MTIRTLVTAFVLATALLFSGAAAHAEEGEGGGIEEQIKQKLQEILRLMKENEEILLRASTGAAGDPRKVDLDVPEPPGKGGGSQGGGEGGGQGGSAGKSGGEGGARGGGSGKREELARKMRQLIEGQRQSGGKIPGEMGKLLKMIPSRPGQGQGQGEPKDGKGKPESQQEQEARDARKQLEESEQNQNEPKDGKQSPENPAKQMPPGGKPEELNPDGTKRDDNVPAWMAALPPEIREAMSGGRAEDVPAKYRHLIRRYHLWLQKNRR